MGNHDSRKVLAINLIAILLFSFQAGFAQEISINKVPSNGETTFELESRFQIDNPDFQEKTIVWNIEQLEAPSSWGKNPVYACDPITCHPANKIQGTFIIGPNQTQFFSLQFVHDLKPGTARAKLVFQPVEGFNELSEGISFPVEVVQKPGAAVGLEEKSDKFRLFPNPAKDYILLKNTSTTEVALCEVYDLIGVRKLSITLEPGLSLYRIDLGDLPKGVYWIRLFDKEKNLAFSKNFNKTR